MSQQVLPPRASGALIAQGAAHVRIDTAAVTATASHIVDVLNRGDFSMQDLFHRTPLHPDVPEGDGEAGAEWVFFADVINFSFWTADGEPKYLVRYKGEAHTGYLGLCAAINRTLEQGIPLTKPSHFGEITEQQLDEYLKGEDGVSCPMIKERVACLKEAAEVLQSKYNGSVAKLIAAGGRSAQKLLELLTTDFKCLKDEAILEDGTRVSFYKRAQIFISDVWSLFEGQGLGEFGDIKALTMFADYRVPQSLQHFGVMRYSEELLSRLRSNQLLPNGSAMEVEIRGCSIHAVSLITDAIRRLKSGAEISDVLLDYYLWGLRREKAQEMEKFPYHKTRCIYY